ncbi:MAG: hypothetical protein ACT4OG_03845 [Alphaproteobacteria bacterium]
MDNAFRLSRIYSQGWNAARKLVAEGAVDSDAKTAVVLNPYRHGTAEERERWTKGFTEALQSTAAPFSGLGRKA